MSTPAEHLAAVVRDEGRRVLATLVRTTGSLAVAEDAVSEAVVTALAHWPRSGVPDNPRAWLTTVARNKALDIVRREAGRTTKEREAADLAVLKQNWSESDESAIADDLLRLVFTCCHPTLSVDAQVALSLRTLCGLATSDIARLMLVPEATMAKRLTRAKKKIAAANIPYRVPDSAELPQRLDAVATTVYLMFTAGHLGGETLVRPRLCDEALRLARLLIDLMPDEPSLQGLLALMLFTDSRRATRTDESGGLARLEDQDRSRWNREAIEEGARLMDSALRRNDSRPSRYTVQAAIAACHSTAATYADTDWPRIVMLYDALVVVENTPIVALNRSVAVGESQGPAAGLDALDAIDSLGSHYLWHACRAVMLDRLDRAEEAENARTAALALDPSPVERAYLRAQLAPSSRPVEQRPEET
ncbi:sigma-70 family RNA polymerase sigma factor [Rhodococcus sp. IEGM 1370]|uniref:RNA polymerase sigma factor n=1 Tax=unclassified Rhodococcus (in: high G+C Gram-positive bacteria) TaxID=192944 RepID=UPI0021D2D3A6|nr:MULTISPECIES: sigma-70 family RNA polymerase sigma factor [unclassified Rhodococcus (in: high G+C Gram-positive bacteria)]MDV8075610.1 sigma-70 family RNA polymerase sigma factor [Rhodococcus sp. IEGM 1370]